MITIKKLLIIYYIHLISIKYILIGSDGKLYMKLYVIKEVINLIKKNYTQ